MTELTEFLQARLDEEEAQAREAADAAQSGRWHFTDRGDYVSAVDGPGYPRDTLYHPLVTQAQSYVGDMLPDEIGRFIARHDPARVLAEAAMKRRILDEHTCPCPDPGCRECGACSGDHHADPTPAPCRTLRLLALPYADHPDYRENWRP